MSIEAFICYPCDVQWYAKYSFWRGYHSPCPRCSASRRAVHDILEDNRHMDYRGFDIDGPLFEFENDEECEESEQDLEEVGDDIDDELAEAFGGLCADTSDPDADAEGDADAGAGGGDDGGGSEGV